MWPRIVVLLTALTLASSNHDVHQKGPPPEKPTTSRGHESPLIDILAYAISHGFSKSDVLAKALPFEVLVPHDMFFRVGTTLLERAGIHDLQLAEVAAKAAAKAAKLLGKLTSELYIRTVGYEVAKFLDSAELLTHETVHYFAFMVVTAVELKACIIEADDAESMTTAVVLGLYDIFDALGLVSYDDIKNLFHVFAKELLLQAKKSTTKNSGWKNHDMSK